MNNEENIYYHTIKIFFNIALPDLSDGILDIKAE